jgi:Na+/melibiose symporter-like transporter
MATESIGVLSVGVEPARSGRKRSLATLIAISIFWFALNFHWGMLLTVVVPSQVSALLYQLAPGASAAARAAWVKANVPLTLGIVDAPGLVVALLANPLFGLLSDHQRGRFGRRRPYILAGTALNCLGLLVMAYVPGLLPAAIGNTLAPSILVLTGGLMLTQLANNAAAAPFHALLPDMVPPEQRGTASGIMGFALLFGQIGGLLTPILLGLNSGPLLAGLQSFGDYSTSLERAYLTIIVVIAVMALLTTAFVHEQPWTPSSSDPDALIAGTSRTLALTALAVVLVVVASLAFLHARITFSLNSNTLEVVQLLALVVASIGAARAFHFRPRKHPDFAWVLFTRMLVMMGANIVQAFMLYYMRYVAGQTNDAEAATSTFFIILTLTAVPSTIFAGYGSDRLGRKAMVYLSGGFMAAVGAAFVGAPYLLPSHILELAYIAAAIFGFGYGAYIAVDWALVADVLPSEATYARDMGVWNIGLTIPQVFAVIFGGWLVLLGGMFAIPNLGYTFLFIAFVVFCLAGTVTVRYIKGVR